MEEPRLIIRRAMESDALDIAQLADLSHQFYRTLLPHFLASVPLDYWKRRFLHSLSTKDYYTFLAELPSDKKAGTITGYIEVYRKKTESVMVQPGVRGVIDNLTVHPDYRRLGIASLLLHHAEKVARDFGAEIIELQVAADNLAAHMLYKESGYQTRSMTMEKLVR